MQAGVKWPETVPLCPVGQQTPGPRPILGHIAGALTGEIALREPTSYTQATFRSSEQQNEEQAFLQHDTRGHPNVDLDES